nr:MAG TPA: hypothetical protein [Caudoviricetes sp.]
MAAKRSKPYEVGGHIPLAGLLLASRSAISGAICNRYRYKKVRLADGAEAASYGVLSTEAEYAPFSKKRQ